MLAIRKIYRILLLVAAIFTLVNIGVYWRAQKTVYVPPGRALDLAPETINGVVIYVGDETVAKFALTNKQWQFRAPQAGVLLGTADRETMDAILSFAARTERTTAKISVEDAGLAEISELPQVVFYADQKSRSVYLGNFSEDGEEQYFLLDTDIETPLSAPAALTRVFSRSPEQFRSRNLFEFSARGPDAIVITDADSALEIRQNFAGWNIVSPFQWPAEDRQISALLQLCLSLRAQGFADALPDSARPLATIALKNGGGEQSVTFYREEKISTISTEKNNSTTAPVFAKRNDRPEIYLVDPALANELRNDQIGEVLRRKNLDLLGGREITAINLTERDGKTLTLRRNRDNDGDAWTADGDENFTADSQTAQNLVTLATQLPLLRVLPDSQESTPRFDDNNLTMRARYYDSGGAITTEIQVRGEDDDLGEHGGLTKFYAKVSGRAQTLELHPLAGIALTQPFLAYRSRVVTNFSAGEISELRFARSLDNGEISAFRQVGAANYQQTEPVEKRLSEASNWELLAVSRLLAQLQCVGYIAKISDQAADYGLDRPILKITLVRRDSAPVDEPLTLSIGNEIAPDNTDVRLYAATLTGNPYIFAIDEKQVMRLLRIK